MLRAHSRKKETPDLKSGVPSLPFEHGFHAITSVTGREKQVTAGTLR